VIREGIRNVVEPPITFSKIMDNHQVRRVKDEISQNKSKKKKNKPMARQSLREVSQFVD
jgi:hypothetical protein